MVRRWTRIYFQVAMLSMIVSAIVSTALSLWRDTSAGAVADTVVLFATIGRFAFLFFAVISALTGIVLLGFRVSEHLHPGRVVAH